MAYTNIDDPSAYFQTAIYSGSNSNLSVTNDGNSDLKPDFLWIKQRSSTESHMLVDSTRGVSKYLLSNSTAAELTVTSIVETLDTDGFTLNGASNPVNALGATYVGWQWKANGGTTASNTSGATTTTVQANQDAGFSILTWSGNGSATTLGHGLGVEPEVIIQKARGTTSNWAVYHKQANAAPYNVVTYLNLTDATGIASNSWGTAASDINSNTFYLKHWFNYNTTNVAYCFASKQGYSKFGSYEGNSNANGPFVYTGFKPAFVMLKPADVAEQWVIHDGTRDPFNKTYHYLFANGAEAEAAGGTHHIDLLSNGFKIRTSNANWNASSTVIYMAFAENPFVTSTGIPTTAR
jgi:hypothetical protein